MTPVKEFLDSQKGLWPTGQDYWCRATNALQMPMQHCCSFCLRRLWPNSYRSLTLEGSLSGVWIGMLIPGCYLSSGPSAQHPNAGSRIIYLPSCCPGKTGAWTTQAQILTHWPLIFLKCFEIGSDGLTLIQADCDHSYPLLVSFTYFFSYYNYHDYYFQ